MLLSRGFSLVELMIALALGAVVSLAIIQIMVGSSVTQQLNRALASTQENGRFVMHRLRQDILHAGRYDELSGNFDLNADIAEESIFVRQRPLVLPNTFTSQPTMGIANASHGKNDQLVLTGQQSRDCRGYHLGYGGNTEFPVVNHYYIQNNVLRCRGFDLRVLRGQKAAVGHNNHNSIALLEGVESFQVMYGLGDINNGRVIRYVNAENVTDPARVVALRLALLLRSPESINVANTHSYRLLDAGLVTPSEPFIYRQFETTVSLRNTRYQVRLGGV